MSTSQLNKLVRAALDENPPPMHQNRRPKIYYATQVGAEPPTIVLFCNDPKAFDEPYQRYLLGVFREHLPFGEVPIKLYLRKRQSGDRRADIDTDTDERRSSSAGVRRRFAPVRRPDRCRRCRALDEPHDADDVQGNRPPSDIVDAA